MSIICNFYLFCLHKFQCIQFYLLLGNRTIDHFHKEDVHRYLNIDVYHRHPTNIPSTVHMKYGRPSEGYYQQRNPSMSAEIIYLTLCIGSFFLLIQTLHFPSFNLCVFQPHSPFFLSFPPSILFLLLQ